MGLFLGFLSYSIGLYFSFCANLIVINTILMTVALYYNLKSGRLIPKAPFFFLKTVLAIQGLCVSIWIVKFFVLTLWKMPLVIW